MADWHAHLVKGPEVGAVAVVAEEESDVVGQVGCLHACHRLLQLLLAHCQPRPSAASRLSTQQFSMHQPDLSAARVSVNASCCLRAHERAVAWKISHCSVSQTPICLTQALFTTLMSAFTPSG